MMHENTTKLDIHKLKVHAHEIFLMFQFWFFPFLDLICIVWICMILIQAEEWLFKLSSPRSSSRKYGSNNLLAYQSVGWGLFPTLKHDDMRKQGKLQEAIRSTLKMVAKLFYWWGSIYCHLWAKGRGRYSWWLQVHYIITHTLTQTLHKHTHTHHWT